MDATYPLRLVRIISLRRTRRISAPANGGCTGDEEVDALPHAMFNDLDRVRDNLLLLATTISSDDELDTPLAPFWKASHSSTQRIASRRIRFPYYVRALGSENII